MGSKNYSLPLQNSVVSGTRVCQVPVPSTFATFLNWSWFRPLFCCIGLIRKSRLEWICRLPFYCRYYSSIAWNISNLLIIQVELFFSSLGFLCTICLHSKMPNWSLHNLRIPPNNSFSIHHDSISTTTQVLNIFFWDTRFVFRHYWLRKLIIFRISFLWVLV